MARSLRCDIQVKLDGGHEERRPVIRLGAVMFTPAATYSPTPLPVQYHRPWRA